MRYTECACRNIINSNTNDQYKHSLVSEGYAIKPLASPRLVGDPNL